MLPLRYHSRLPLAFAVLTVAAFAFSPLTLRASQRPAVADFVPPVSTEMAQQIVATARQADTQARARQLNAVSPDALPSVQTLYVTQTGHHLSDRAGFLTFWRENGGVLLFGYPVTEEIVENGRVVQYFERVRFELHPEATDPVFRIQLSLLGRELTAGRTFAPGAPGGGEMFFPETGHTLSGKFKTFWLKRGGLQIFGLPISEPMDEVSTSDGQTYTVQYFERARFEYHPDDMGSFYHQEEQALGLSRLATLHEVQLSDLGRQMAQRKGLQIANDPQLPSAVGWSPTIWPRRIDVNLSTQELTAYEGNTPVYHAPVATGKDGFNTPIGTFAIYSKSPMETMRGSAGGETWYVPDIPWVQYVVGGVALHGTYWHDRWGTGFRLSHGCINLNIDDAQWLYEWADVGTQVDIHG